MDSGLKGEAQIAEGRREVGLSEEVGPICCRRDTPRWEVTPESGFPFTRAAQPLLCGPLISGPLVQGRRGHHSGGAG